MKAKLTIILFLFFLTSTVFVQAQQQKSQEAENKETLVLIDTDKGKIKVKLYNDTPLHRDNFIKNVHDKVYDGLLFHRVVKQFIIQSGDPKSKNAAEGEQLGIADSLNRIPAEIIYPKYFHQSGQLCAARISNEKNPNKESSATQFYIVTGKFFTEMELDKMEKATGVTFTPEQREAYMLKGGYPDLDGEYTIFGEVVSGIKAVHKIQMVPTDGNERPIKDVRIKSMAIVEK